MASNYDIVPNEIDRFFQEGDLKLQADDGVPVIIKADGTIVAQGFKDVQDPIQLFQEIKKVDGKWVLFSMIFGAWAIINRGLRWIVLIDALGYKASKKNSIAAVAILYFTNLFIPRGGEISRCTALSKAEKVPVDKLFGTILIERAIDFVFLFAD